jgi:hypothetical protein
MILDKLVRRQVIRTVMLRSTGIPDWLKDGSAFGENGISQDMDKYMVQVTQTRHDAEELSVRLKSAGLKNEEEIENQLQCLLEETRRLNDEMLQWTTTLPSDWSYEAHPLNSVALDYVPYGGTVHTYPSAGHAGIWNRYRTVRILLIRVEVDLFQLAAAHWGHHLDQQIQNSTKSIRDLVEDICASIPYCFNDFTVDRTPGTLGSNSLSQANDRTLTGAGCHLAFPMHAVVDTLKIAGLSETQAQWIRAQLARIGRALDASMLEKIAGI